MNEIIVGTGHSPSPLRRMPTQQRSRDRVNRMLAAASALIAEKGSDALHMSDVAERAGVSIGSLYQYFPDKSAIIQTLVATFYDEGRDCVHQELDGVTDRASFRLALHALTDGYYEMFLNDPAMLDIWSGAQADKTLQAMDVQENRKIGELIAEVIERLDPECDRATIATDALMLSHLMCSAVRLATSVDRDEGRVLLDAFKRLMDARFASAT
jgi:AcrR family transcriptional regulator